MCENIFALGGICGHAVPMKEAQLQWSQAQTIQKKLCTTKFFTFWYPFFLLPKLKRGNNWIILSFTLKASYLTITWILLFVTNHVTECLRKIPSELISKIYVLLKIWWNDKRNWHKIYEQVKEGQKDPSAESKFYWSKFISVEKSQLVSKKTFYRPC